ncbi:hypothetical protein AB0E69_25295 [Kribbella sp. NPDC026611]|uniref:hypothetical protein n=1 Tax=Kribbella sp. NPDC026611 TaxID=3154911 RepID=UPI00340E8488
MLTVLGVGLTSQVHAAAEHIPARHAGDQQVTLVTGDRITLSGGDPAQAALSRGPGRDGITFRTLRTKDHFYVIPSDVSDQVAAGRLDRRLFDVTGLIKAGYDDRSTGTLPVLVTSEGAALRSTVPGAAVSRRLPIVNGVSMKVDKARAATFLTGAASAGVKKIWLDGQREVSLDRSVPQLGAPARAEHLPRRTH